MDKMNTALEKTDRRPRFSRLKIILTAAAAVVLALVIIVTIFTLRRAPLKPLYDYFSAVEKADGQKLADSLPECILFSYENSPLTDGMDSAAAYFEEELLRDTLYELEEDYGKRVRIRFKENERSKLDTAALNEITEDLEAYGSTVTVTRAYRLSITYTIKGSSGSTSADTEVTVCKADGKWTFAGLPDIIL